MRNTLRPVTATLPLPEERLRLSHLAKIRWGLLAAVLLLALIGLLTVRSASAELGIDYFPRQATWIGLGLLALLLFGRKSGAGR